jgi:hypothetical protein
VIQVAEQSGPPPRLPAPAQLPVPGLPTAFALVEHHVGDLDDAVRLYAEVLDGQVVSSLDLREASVAEVAWDNGARLRLAAPAPGSRGRLGSLTFVRDGESFSAAEGRRAAHLARRLAVSLELGA